MGDDVHNDVMTNHHIRRILTTTPVGVTDTRVTMLIVAELIAQCDADVAPWTGGDILARAIVHLLNDETHDRIIMEREATVTGE